MKTIRYMLLGMLLGALAVNVVYAHPATTKKTIVVHKNAVAAKKGASAINGTTIHRKH